MRQVFKISLERLLRIYKFEFYYLTIKLFILYLYIL